ncbi:MAG TPA: hypothetical protein VJV23_07800 [Candidatus Polarisedimenticolia bacterium]|nr:hypothetical protein [Candidatus Polarisedimenticolia bacterium]
MATAIVLGAPGPPASASLQCQVNSGVATVDDVTNTDPQDCGIMVVGQGGTATLNILDGRLIRATQTVHISLSASGTGASDGTVNVMGNYSRLQGESSVYVGFNPGTGNGALGRLNIGAGGLVSAATALVPRRDGVGPAQGFVTISGPGSMLDVAGSLTLGQGDSSVTIGTGGTLSLGSSITISGGGVANIFLEGGTLSLTGPSVVPGGFGGGIVVFSSGAFRFRSSQTLDGGAGFYTNYLGSPPVLPAGRGLIVDGTTTLVTALAIDGGSLRTGRIDVDSAGGSVSLSGGTLTLTGDRAVLDDGSDFGPDPLVVGDGAGDRARLVLRSPETMLLGDVTVMTDGTLSFSGEALVLDSLDNSGSVTVVGATLDARGGLVNTGSLRLTEVVVEGDVTSPAGSSVDVSGTVVFNGFFSGAADFYGSGTVIFNGGASSATRIDAPGVKVIYRFPPAQ